MKINKILSGFIVSILLILISCKKDLQYQENVRLMIVNSGIGLGGIKVKIGNSSQSYENISAIGYNTGSFFYSPQGQVPFQIVPSSDTAILLLNSTLTTETKMYSIFIVGQSPNTDTVFREETDIPFIRQDVNPPSQDSVVNVRFVNLSPNSTPIKIKISSATSNEVESLSYKTISNWKGYPAKATTTTYSFQIRNSATDELVTTFNFTANATNRFKNVTLVIRGLQGTTSGTNAFGVSVVNYY